MTDEQQWHADNAAATKAGKEGVVLPKRGTPERKDLALASDREAARFLAQALEKVESASIRAWTQTPHNLPLWLEMAEDAINRGKTDPDRFAAYIVAVAIGL